MFQWLGIAEVNKTGIEVGKELWKNRDKKVEVSGCLSVVTPDMKNQVQDELVTSSGTIV